MIIKGNSRGGASQLARHLQRTDTNEIVTILQIDHPIQDLEEAFRDWQLLSTGTQQGKKGLYHSSINPDHYDMTPEQWLRAVEVLEKELGFEGQPRAVILHQKPDENGIDRAHIHVVWQRTDVETMTLKTDSMNYPANERASLTLEEEFGHEKVLGKHAKRDRKQQPDFPRSETTHDEWQQGERTGIRPEQRRAEIQALKAGADNAQSFKAALEEAGYTLARGDRGYTLVDQNGDHFNLAKQLKIKIEQVNEFMKAIPLDSLPELEHEKQRAKTQPKEAPKEPEQPPTTETPKPEEQSQQPTAPQSHKPTPELPTDLEKALKKRHEQEGETIKQRQEQERKGVSEAFDDELKERLAERRALQKAELDPLYSTGEEYSDKWMRRFIEILKHRWNPAAAEQQRLERQQKIDEIKTRHRIERDTMRQNLKMEREQALDDLKAIHDKQQADHAAKYPEELARYKQEQEAAQKIIKQMEEKKRQEELTKKPDEPDPPKPSL